MSENWHRKLGADRLGIHPLLVEAADHIKSLERSLAASRALVADLRSFVIEHGEGIHKVGEGVLGEEWSMAHCRGHQSERLLALSEADMLKRLEEESAR